MKILITGVTGQDGAYLAKSLLEKKHEVFGTIRRGSTPRYGRLQTLGILEKLKFVPLELTEFSNVFRTIDEIRPDQIYNLAAQSFVQDSFLHPALTSEINYLGALNVLEAIKLLKCKTAFYQASTSEMFGDVTADTQNEMTSLNPTSPYAVAKCAAHYATKVYRDAYGISASSGILFNHESELRGREFVTRKITHRLAEFKYGAGNPVRLGNLNAIRDWGYAPDYVEAMQLITNSNLPSDYVVATNVTSTVREFFRVCARVCGYDPQFEGEGPDERCVDKVSGQTLCLVDQDYFRPLDVNYLCGDYRKIKTELGWEPTVSVDQMAQRMMEFDLALIKGDVNYFGI